MARYIIAYFVIALIMPIGALVVTKINDVGLFQDQNVTDPLAVSILSQIGIALSIIALTLSMIALRILW